MLSVQELRVLDDEGNSAITLTIDDEIPTIRLSAGSDQRSSLIYTSEGSLVFLSGDTYVCVLDDRIDVCEKNEDGQLEFATPTPSPTPTHSVTVAAPTSAPTPLPTPVHLITPVPVQSIPVVATPIVKLTPVAVTPIAQQTTAAGTPIARQTPVAARPIVRQTPVAVTPIVRQTPVAVTPIVQQTPVAVTAIVQQTPVAVAPIVQQTPVTVAPIVQQTPVTVAPIVQHTPVAVTPTVPETPVTPTPTLGEAPPPSEPHLRHVEEKMYMLDLINEARAQAGVAPVALGDNAAPQLHVEAGLQNCYSAHWDLHGLKSYMRYSLSGGFQVNAENVSGNDYCITALDRIRAVTDMREYIRDKVMKGLLDSPGHRRTIVNPLYRKVSIGLAWDTYNVKVSQHFEGDFIDYDQLPSIDDGIVSMSGAVKNGVTLKDGDNSRDLGVVVYYDPPPHPLTAGQLARTYCVGLGRRVAELRKPLPPKTRYTSDDFTKSYSPCPDPHDVPADAPPPSSRQEARSLWQAAKDASDVNPSVTIAVQWVTASRWMVGNVDFSVEADLRDILALHGKGVYTVVLWGNLNGEREPISRYSIFHGVIAAW